MLQAHLRNVPTLVVRGAVKGFVRFDDARQIDQRRFVRLFVDRDPRFAIA